MRGRESGSWRVRFPYVPAMLSRRNHRSTEQRKEVGNASRCALSLDFRDACLRKPILGSVGPRRRSQTSGHRRQAPDFKLPGVDGKTYSLKDFADAKILVVVFTCNHCPTAQAYEDRLDKMVADYKNKGVAVVAISPNDPEALRLDELGFTDVSDSFEEMKIRAKDRNITYPYLYDGDTQETAHDFGVLATPHVYIFDAERTLRYQGRIDDSEFKTVTSHDARNAIDALLAGKPVPVATTRVFGCSTKWADKRADVAKALAKWDAEEIALESLDDKSLAKLVKNDSKKYLLINVWATWCGPCVAELPELTTLHRMYRTRPFRLVTISRDEPKNKDDALRVLKENHLSSANYFSTTDHQDHFADALDKEMPGAIPYTILIAPGGKIVYRKSGAFDPLELKKEIVKVLGRTY